MAGGATHSSLSVGWFLMALGGLHWLLCVTAIVLASVFNSDEYAIKVGGLLSMYISRLPMYVFPVLYPVAVVQNGAIIVFLYFLAGSMIFKIGWRMSDAGPQATKQQQPRSLLTGTSGLSIFGMVIALGMILIGSVSGLNLIEILIPTFISITTGTLIIHYTVLLQENTNTKNTNNLWLTLFLPAILLCLMFFPPISSIQVFGWTNVNEGGLPPAYSGMIIGSFIIVVVFYLLILFMRLCNVADEWCILTNSIMITLWNLYINWFYFSIILTTSYLDSFNGLNKFIGVS